MKKQLLTAALILGSIFFVNAQQTITHNNDSELLEAGGSVGCGTGVNLFSRSFVLEDFDIAGDFEVTQVEFGLQDYFATPVTVKLYTTSQAYPGGYPGALTELASEEITFEENGESLFVMKQVDINATVPAGSELVVEISGEFFISGNMAGSTAPSYLMSETCGATTPTNVEEFNFPDVNYVINVTGLGGTAGITDLSGNAFTIYPNPADNLLTIAGSTTLDKIEIADINGRIVKSVSVEDAVQASVNVSDLASGMYMVTVTSGNQLMTKKIVKK